MDNWNLISNEENPAEEKLMKSKSSAFSSVKAANNIELIQILLRTLANLVEELQPNKTDRLNNETEKIDLDSEVQQFETELIRKALIKTQGCQKSAADLLGVKNTTLNAKIKRYGINYRILKLE